MTVLGRPLRAFVIAVLACAFGSVSAVAQQSPALTITVIDPSGGVLVGAHVTITGDTTAGLSIDTDVTGIARFVLPASGRYGVRVEAAGFEPATIEELNVRRPTSRTIKMQLARVRETVDVGRDPRERASDLRGDLFATILGAAEIRELPDDPDEMERVLRDMAGPGAVMRVNGFRGGRLPPKDQIAQIRFHRNMFAADAHEPGFISVDIVTKPGLEGWRGSTGIGFRTSSFNARNAFAPERGDEQYGRGSLSLSGPLWRKHTSISLSIDGTGAHDSQIVRAALLSGLLSQNIRRPNDAANGSLRLEHAVSSSQQLRVEVQRSRSTADNLGITTFDLPERGYRQDRTEYGVRGSLAGSLGSRLYNELRLSWRNASTDSRPALEAPTVVVPGAFTSGGAQIDGTRHASVVEAADDLDIARGRHAIRTGILFEWQGLRTDEARNTLGTFAFSSLDAYARQQPTTFTRTVGNAFANASQTQLGAYMQDDYRVSQGLMVSGGVRQEFQSEAGGFNLGPRGGIAWSPTRSGTTTIRAGGGLFFTWFDAQDYLKAVQLDGAHQQVETIVAPAFPLDGAGVGGTTLTDGRVQFAPVLSQPRLFETTFAVEQSFPLARVNVMVLRRRGTHDWRGIDINAPDLSGHRPNPAAGPITEIRTDGTSAADALSINLNILQPERRVFIAANYTLSRSTNESDSAFSLPADPRNIAAERGPAIDDARHRVMAFASFPVAPGITAGVSLNARSALPYDITTGRDDNGDSLSTDRPAGVTRNTGRGRALVDVGARVAWRIGFGTAPPVPAGPQVRVVRSGSDANPLADMPAGLAATRYTMEFYAQAFNALNHLNATTIAGVTTSPFFGSPVAAAQPRRVEVGARLTF